MLSIHRLLVFALLFSISFSAKSQDKAIIEVSLPFFVAYSFIGNKDVHAALNIPLSVNYFIHKKLSAGLNVFASELYVPVEQYRYHRLDENSPYQLSSVGEDATTDQLMTGAGINVRFNYITHRRLNAYVQIDAIYAKYSNYTVYFNVIVWEQSFVDGLGETLNENGDYVNYLYEGPPLTEQYGMSFNLATGIDLKLNRRFALYFQYQLFDLFNSIDLINHKEEQYYTFDENDWPLVDDVKYSESEVGTVSYRYIMVGVRLYIGTKKL